MARLTTAERNRRKRERKKKERAAALAAESSETPPPPPEDAVEIEYVPEELPVNGDEEALEVLRRFQVREAEATAIDDEEEHHQQTNNTENATATLLSKRKLRAEIRPTVAALKRKVIRPDLVEAHDVAATDPEFLLRLKAVPGSVPVPRHWGRKRKYLQGKKGYEKPPFQLPQFIIDTGIAELRDSVMQGEDEQTAKQKNRARTTPKLGAIDVDYRTLHDAFFKHQTIPTNLTKVGDIYYEGKELQVGLQNVKPGRPLSTKLQEALGMTSTPGGTSPPPWLWNMQRYGPPPSWSGLAIPGLTAPLPDSSCQYGYHPTGWGKPPIDAYGRPLYGGNPLDPPGSSAEGGQDNIVLVTSDGKRLSRESWGALPDAGVVADDDEEEEDESSSDGMEESEEEGEEEEQEAVPAALDNSGGIDSILPPPMHQQPTAPTDLRKGTDTPKVLYQVLDETVASAQPTAVFASQVAYAVKTTSTEDGAASVLSKATGAAAAAANKRKRKEDEDDTELKNFKF